MNTSSVQPLVYKGVFTSKHNQHLRSVLIQAPTLIWIKQGIKRIWWADTMTEIASGELIVLPAGLYLTLTNIPTQGRFLSHTLSFTTLPPAEWINKDSAKQFKHGIHTTPLSAEMRMCMQAVESTLETTLSIDAQLAFIRGLYAQLKAENLLHGLFPSSAVTLADRVGLWLSNQPARDITMTEVASQFAMSRATFARKLNAEGHPYRSLLTHIRMNQALNLLQQGQSVIDVALACGYLSDRRFAQQFKKQFGLTPKQYIQTIGITD